MAQRAVDKPLDVPAEGEVLARLAPPQILRLLAQDGLARDNAGWEGTVAVGALRVVQHGGSLFVTGAAKCAFLRQILVLFRLSVTNIYRASRALTMGTTR